MTEVRRRDTAAHTDAASFLARDRRRALSEGKTLPQVVTGAALFADISGFTPLTEALAAELGPQHGAEELSIHLDTVFHSIIDDIHGYGGEVLNFSGDAITCWLDGDDGVRAAACGVAIQRTMAAIGRIRTSTGTEVVLSIKVTVAVGQAHRFSVGDASEQLLEVLAGSLIDELADAEQVASPSDVVLAPSAVASLGARVTVVELRKGGDGTGARLLDTLLSTPDPHPQPPDPELADDLVRPWVLPVVYERVKAGRGEFLRELRPAFPMFMRFGGLDVDEGEDVVGHLDDFISRCQSIITRFGGNVIQLTHGDKGAYLYAVFGAPQAHEDDGVRAVSAAVELLELERATEARDLQIGISHGRVYSGTYGHTCRLTFGCLGDSVNLAARLMMSAPPGRIFVTDEVRVAAGHKFQWTSVGDLVLKGKSLPVRAHELLGHDDAVASRSRAGLPMVGRARELAKLRRVRDDVLAGAGRVVAITGEGGRGKSRLLAEVAHDLERAGATVVQGAADAFGRTRSYLIWRTATRELFGLDAEASEAEQVAAVERTLEAVSPGHGQRAPLVAPVIGIDIADNDLTASFDAKLRKASLEALLADALRARAALGPVAVLLDDAQWIDDLSVDLLDVLIRATTSRPVLFVVASRPSDIAVGGFTLDDRRGVDRIELDALTESDAEMVVHAKVAELWGADAVTAPAVTAFAVERAQGNPFYLESIVDWIRSRGLDPTDDGAIEGLELPNSLHSLVLSRMDAIDESPRRTLKVASVVGRSFATPALHGVYPDLGDLDAIEGHLVDLDSAELVAAEPDEMSWCFRHLMTYEVAYESLPFTLRAELHGRAGAYLELRDEVESIDLDLLAHHYWNSDDLAKKLEYLERAGAAAQHRYANAAAIDYFGRLAGLLSGARRADALLRLGKVLALVGDWERARDTTVEAHQLSLAHDDPAGAAWCEVALAELDRKQGRYDDAQARLDHARDAFGAAGADDGIGQVLHLTGTLTAQQGEYDRARQAYEESIAVRERSNDCAGIAAALSNLGVLAEYAGEYRDALALHARALDLRHELGDRWAIAVSCTNVGMIAVHEERFVDAGIAFREAMRLNLEVGDLWMVAICHNNLGNALRGIGDHDAACEEYAAAAKTYEEYNDHWAIAFLLEDVALLCAAMGLIERAYTLLGAADRQRDELGSPRAPALEAKITETLDAANADAALGTKARRRGAHFTTEDALTALLSVCVTESSSKV